MKKTEGCRLMGVRQQTFLDYDGFLDKFAKEDHR